MSSIFGGGDFWGLGGPTHPNGGTKSKKSGYCEYCSRNHSVDFVHDVIGPVVGIAVLGFTLGALGGLLRSQQN